MPVEMYGSYSVNGTNNPSYAFEGDTITVTGSIYDFNSQGVCYIRVNNGTVNYSPYSFTVTGNISFSTTWYENPLRLVINIRMV